VARISTYNSNVPFGPFGPFGPFIDTYTNKKFNRGDMTNGVHQDRWIKLSVTLYLAGRSFRCHSCGRTIEKGEIYGHETVGDSFCRNCIEIPVDVYAWKVTYKLKRRSRRNPDGFKTLYVVNTREKFNQYLRELTIALGGREVSVNQLADARCELRVKTSTVEIEKFISGK
jgi:hypothetical protein